METIAVMMALGASLTRALASIVAHRPVCHFGTFDFLRIQLPTSSVLLCVVVSVSQSWGTVVWSLWPALVTSGIVGILLGDLALYKCLHLGGPRRMQTLFAMHAPMVSVLGFYVLGEAMSAQDAIGGLLVLMGVSARQFCSIDRLKDVTCLRQCRGVSLESCYGDLPRRCARRWGYC